MKRYVAQTRAQPKRLYRRQMDAPPRLPMGDSGCAGCGDAGLGQTSYQPKGTFSRGVFDQVQPYSTPEYVTVEPDGVDGLGDWYEATDAEATEPLEGAPSDGGVFDPVQPWATPGYAVQRSDFGGGWYEGAGFGTVVDNKYPVGSLDEIAAALTPALFKALEKLLTKRGLILLKKPNGLPFSASTYARTAECLSIKTNAKLSETKQKVYSYTCGYFLAKAAAETGIKAAVRALMANANSTSCGGSCLTKDGLEHYLKHTVIPKFLSGPIGAFLKSIGVVPSTREINYLVEDLMDLAFEDIDAALLKATSPTSLGTQAYGTVCKGGGDCKSGICVDLGPTLGKKCSENCGVGAISPSCPNSDNCRRFIGGVAGRPGDGLCKPSVRPIMTVVTGLSVPPQAKLKALSGLPAQLRAIFLTLLNCLANPNAVGCKTVLSQFYGATGACLKTPTTAPCPAILYAAQVVLALCKQHPAVGACPDILKMAKAAGIPTGTTASSKLPTGTTASSKLPLIIGGAAVALLALKFL